ncbi:MAG: DUF503 domain-containing protein [Desulfonauticus sp.]|nr:DUF503 domain-containing protein [Desulfonauticus sp.]
MFIGILKITFKLHAVFSLKEKRKISQSLKQKIKNKYNVSIAETKHQNTSDFLEISLVTVSNDAKHVESILNKIKDYIESISSEEIIEINSDIFAYEI